MLGNNSNGVSIGGGEITIEPRRLLQRLIYSRTEGLSLRYASRYFLSDNSAIVLAISETSCSVFRC